MNDKYFAIENQYLSVLEEVREKSNRIGKENFKLKSVCCVIQNFV